MIDPFEQMFDEKFLKKEIVDFFGEFDPMLWSLDAGTLKRFAEHLESGEPVEDFYRHEIGFVYQSCWNCATNDERGKYLAIRNIALSRGCKSALDYGCGIGTGVIALALAGVERSIGADICLPNLAFLDARAERFGLQDKVKVVDVYGKSTRHKVDLIVCTEVFEHVEDPVGLAEFLDKRLNPGGAMVLSWSFVKMPTHLEQHFTKGWQASHPDTIATEGFGKEVMIDLLGYAYGGLTWFNNMLWLKPDGE